MKYDEDELSTSFSSFFKPSAVCTKYITVQLYISHTLSYFFFSSYFCIQFCVRLFTFISNSFGVSIMCADCFWPDPCSKLNENLILLLPRKERKQKKNHGKFYLHNEINRFVAASLSFILYVFFSLSRLFLSFIHFVSQAHRRNCPFQMIEKKENRTDKRFEQMCCRCRCRWQWKGMKISANTHSYSHSLVRTHTHTHKSQQIRKRIFSLPPIYPSAVKN